jgi:uncharacterized protein (DUF433 family)
MAAVVGPFVGRGIYDPTEAARLLRVSPGVLAGWTGGRRPVLRPSGGAWFDFADLVSLLVVVELRRRRVPLGEIRRGTAALARALGIDRPLAHLDVGRGLGSAGRAFFAHVGEWANAGRGMQLAFHPMVEPVIRPLDYGDDAMACRWRPAAGVSAAPTIQAGAPCLDGTRVPTATVAGLLRAGESAGSVAFHLDLTPEQVEVARRFEAALRDAELAASVLAAAG